MTNRRLLSVGIIGLGIGFITVVFNHLQTTGEFRWRWQMPEAQISAAPTPSPSPTPQPLIPPIVPMTQPQQLIVPAIGVASTVEFVGLDPKGRMDVPKNDLNVAWFQLGVPIGERGSAVIAGHYDAKDGGPAVFYDLQDLKNGDEIIIRGEGGRSLTFVVEEVAQYKEINFPLERVFNVNDKRRLNLITCAGTFSRSQQNYSDRLVVYTVLKEV